MTNNAAEAEDFTQDAFLQVFRKIETFRGNSAFSTWLHRIAVNTVLMCLRKKSLREVSLDVPDGGADGATMPREYGTKDDRWRAPTTEWHWPLQLQDFLTVEADVFSLEGCDG